MRRLPIVQINGKSYFRDDRLRELRNIKDPHEAKKFQSDQDLATYCYWTQELQTIVGQTVVSAELQFDEWFDDWAPVLRFSNGEAMMLLSDEEGNNPGRFAYLT
jgi:hypothetical protein